MSSVYQKPYTIPEGFAELLKQFTREILRAQPENIYQFGADYFANKLNPVTESEPAPEEPRVDLHLLEVAASVDVSSMETSHFGALVLKLFVDADEDKSGYLDRIEFSNVLRNAELHLSEPQIRRILSEADDNDDNLIEYREFVPVMVDILQGIRADIESQAMKEEAEVLVRDAVDVLLRGMGKKDLETLMLKVFSKSDVDRNGTLDRKEFKNCLKSAHLGLTRKDINLIMSSVDLNQDGVISYAEFIPVCYEVLVERFKEEVIRNQITSNSDSLQNMLLEAFQTADPSSTGLIPRGDLKAILKQLSYETLGLSTLQLVNLISKAPVTQSGQVQYIQFVPVAANIIYRIYDVDAIKLRIQAIKSVTVNDSVEKMSRLDFNVLRSSLERMFLEVDSEDKGFLTEDQVIEVLDRLGTLEQEIELTEGHKQAMFAAVDSNSDGKVDWHELVSFICDAIEHVERESALNLLLAQ